MKYKDRLEDLVAYYLSKDHTYTEVQTMLKLDNKLMREMTIDTVTAAIKKLIDEKDAPKGEA